MFVTVARGRGERLNQEDRYVVHPYNSGALLAVMDGHGGPEVADVLEQYVGLFWEQIVDGLDGNVDYKAALHTLVRDLAYATADFQEEGSTLSVVYVPQANGSEEQTVYAAVLGDSPVVIRDKYGVTHIGPIHNVRSNPEEAAAVVARGGSISGGYAFSRFNGQGIQLSRSLGDGYFGPMVSKEPAVYEQAIGDFILIASDGLFDPNNENTTEEIGNVVRMIDNGADADDLVNRAVNVKTGDNATALLLRRQAHEPCCEQSLSARESWEGSRDEVYV